MATRQKKSTPKSPAQDGPRGGINPASQKLAADTLTFLLERSREPVTDDNRLTLIALAIEQLVNEVTERLRNMRGEEAVKRFRGNLSVWWRK